MNKIKDACDHYVVVLQGQLAALKERDTILRQKLVTEPDVDYSLTELTKLWRTIERTKYALTIVKIIQSADNPDRCKVN